MTSQEISTRTFGNEDALPRVPLPTVADSCARFLQWCAPLLTADELAATEAAVAEFLAPGSPAHTLQDALREFDATDGVASWLDVFWPYRYLGRRDRIALNANFFFLFRDNGSGQVERAAELIATALAYKRRIDDETLPPATQRGAPQTMQQQHHLFSATRIPGAEIDTARLPYTDAWPGPSTERHIVVLHRGRMFRVDVLGADGTPHTMTELADALRAVRAAAEPAPPGTSVGHLTTKARAEWAASRQALLDLDPANADALDLVERALFCVCLEDTDPADAQDAGARMLHGDSANRWFDKALSFIVFPDGTAGINVEHCCLDGTTILALLDGMLGSPADEQSRASGARTQGTPAVSPIEFVLDDDLVRDVRAAAESFTDYAAQTATELVAFDDFGSGTAKQLGMSPDAFVQLAFQLAHRRAKGLTGATYESIATRQFRHGRTEAMRVITPEMVAFVDAMVDPGVDRDTRRAAATAAAQAHVARAKQCQAGDAPEQHLWELQLIQQRRGAELGVTEAPALYRSPGWVIMRDDYLSTSSAPSVNVVNFGFGSTSARCIGVAYVLLPEEFNVYLSTPAAVGDQMRAFAEQLRAAIPELRALLG